MRIDTFLTKLLFGIYLWKNTVFLCVHHALPCMQKRPFFPKYAKIEQPKGYSILADREQDLCPCDIFYFFQ